MVPPKSDGSSLFSRVVREPLDAVVAPLVRDALIHDALSVMGLSVPPLERGALERFVSGGLSSVLDRALGAELGRSVVEEMLRALASVHTGPRPPRPGPRIPRPRNAPQGSRTTSSMPPPVSARNVTSSMPPPVSARNVTSSMPPPVSARNGTSSVPPPLKGATTLPPAPDSSPRSSPASALPRPRPTPVPYGMRRPTPPPGMVDARSRPPHPPHAEGNEAASYEVPPMSGERTRGVRSRPPMPSITVPRAPVVLVGTEDRSVFETLARSFEDRARVRRVLSAADVVRELDEAGASRKLVILDAKMPTIRPAALAVLLESMRGVDVVLCRSVPETEELILSVSSASANWIIYREPAPLDRVAEACIELVS
jgi:hypothetical protein